MKITLLKWLCVLVGSTCMSAYAVVPVVTNITATQRAGTKLVDIIYTLDDADSPTATVSVAVSTNNGGIYDLPVTNFSGSGYGAGVTPGTGKTIVWDAAADWGGQYSTQVWFKVVADDGTTPVVTNINSTSYGMMTSNEIWRGTFIVKGDVTIPPGVRLTVEPGAEIRFLPNTDFMHEGSTNPITDPYFPHDPPTRPTEMCEIRVYGGTLYAEGTHDQPIIFTSDTNAPVRGDWQSISFSRTNSTLVLKNCQIKYGYYGVQINVAGNSNEIVIASNVIQHIVTCAICTGIETNQPVSCRIYGNDFSNCGHEAIDTHANASVVIENNIFHDNLWSYGDGAFGVGIVIDGNSSVIQNNSFISNRVGISIMGSGPNPVITNNVFQGNDEDIHGP